MRLTGHWVESAIRSPIDGGEPMPVRRFAVIHFTAGASAKSSIDYWRTSAARGASAHIVIDRDGTIYQCRPFDRTAGHAGRSTWNGFTRLNACSIGIELANAGDNPALGSKWSQFPLLKARHKHGGPERSWEVYPASQLHACEALVKLLVKRYQLDDVIGHEDIAPDRKCDPGPAFPMAALRVACGFSPVPNQP